MLFPDLTLLIMKTLVFISQIFYFNRNNYQIYLCRPYYFTCPITNYSPAPNPTFIFTMIKVC